MMNCRRCSTKILRKEVARHSTHPYKLANGQEYRNWYVVSDMFDFENIGFLRDADGVKWLICAECESEVIGYHLLPLAAATTAVKEFCLCGDLVVHEPEPADTAIAAPIGADDKAQTDMQSTDEDKAASS